MKIRIPQRFKSKKTTLNVKKGPFLCTLFGIVTERQGMKFLNATLNSAKKRKQLVTFYFLYLNFLNSVSTKIYRLQLLNRLGCMPAVSEFFFCHNMVLEVERSLSDLIKRRLL